MRMIEFLGSQEDFVTKKEISAGTGIAKELIDTELVGLILHGLVDVKSSHNIDFYRLRRSDVVSELIADINDDADRRQQELLGMH